MIEQDDIRVEEDGGVLVVTLSRPAKLNAVTPAMLDALRGAVETMRDRDDLRVLLITAEGKFFTAGIDIGTLDPDPGLAADGTRSGIRLREGLKPLHRLIDSFESLEKPVILAAQGPCLGLGLEMAVSCDFRFASQRAYFALPEIPNMGVIAGSGGISRLTRLVGPHWASWLGLASRPVDAAMAKQIGLVHEVYAEDVFADEVRAFAADLAGMPREALALAKLAIQSAASSDRTAARDFDRVANTLLIMSEQNREAVASYRNKKS